MADVLMDIQRKDTICALATPLAPAALAVVRVSGHAAAAIKDIVFRPLRDHQRNFVATLGIFHDPVTNEKIDEVLCTAFPEGKSYTGESAFELSLHGNQGSPKGVECPTSARLPFGRPGRVHFASRFNGKNGSLRGRGCSRFDRGRF